MVRIPGFSIVFDVLCRGVGLATSVATNLSGLRSYEGKQELYYRRKEGKSFGLLPCLVTLLTNNDAALNDRLEMFFSQYEHIFSHLKSRPVITSKSYEFGVAHFLDVWVIPQLTVLLSRLSNELIARQPLYHLEKLLVSDRARGGHWSTLTKSYVKSHLPDGVKVPGFLNDLDKIEKRSHKKNQSIYLEVEALKQELISSGLSVEERERTIEIVHASYLAAVIFGRFWVMFDAYKLSPDTTLLERFQYFSARVASENTGDFIDAHIGLFEDFIAGSIMDDISCRTDFAVICNAFDQRVEAVDIHLYLPLEELVSATEDNPNDRAAIEAAFAQFRCQPDFSMYEVFSVQTRATTTLLGGEPQQALAMYKQVLSFSSKQQLGHLALYAASYAIVLEVMETSPLPNGYLNQLVNFRIEAQPQQVEWVGVLPTVFSTLSASSTISTYTQAVFSSIREFNIDMACESSRYDVIYCNPLKKLDTLMGAFFQSLPDLNCNSTTLKKLIGKAIKGKDRGRSVLSFASVTPYLALRDECYYALQFFGGLPLYFKLNPNLHKYFQLPDGDKKHLLHVLSPDRFKFDSSRGTG